MENRTLNHNRNNFKKECSSKIYNNPMCELLPNDSIREEIFNGTLDENDCGHKDLRTFLNLIQDKDVNRITNHSPLKELGWENIVKNQRKCNFFHVFSQKLRNV